MKLTLKSSEVEASQSRLANASTAVKAEQETLEQAWARIKAGKHSEPEKRKLAEVYEAMQKGDISREPTPAGKKPKKFSKAEALRIYVQLAESQKEQKLAEMVANMPKNYVLVTSIFTLIAIIDKAFKEPIIAVDTETTGLDVYTDRIVGVSLTLPNEDKHYYIAFKPTEDERALDAEHLGLLNGLMSSTSVGKVYHNAIYDIAMFARHGIKAQGTAWDTQTAMHLLNENEERFALKILATKYLNEPSDTFAELFGKDAKFAEIPLDIALAYAAKDTDVTWRLYKYQLSHMERFPEMLTYYRTVEVPLLSVIVDLEANGYLLDLDFAKKYGEELHAESERLYAKVIEAVTPFHEGDEPINVNSNTQMLPAMSALIGEQLPNMQKGTLKHYAEKHEIINDLLEYKRIAKLSSTYIDALPKLQNPTTGRWHSRFNPMGTVTGRFSSGKGEATSGYNVQNQPAEARAMFVAPPGKVIIGADFKAQEIRAVASLSQEPALLKAFEDGLDPYAMLAVQFTGLPYDECNKNADGSDTVWRKKMKVAWLAWLYGASNNRLAEWLGVTKNEAERFMGDLKASLPVLSAWLEGNDAYVKKQGYVWCDKKQRKRRLPAALWKTKNIPWGKYWDDKYKEQRKHNGEINKALRQGTNAKVQGSSSIQTKVTMLEADRVCKAKGWALWGTVHDELLFEVPEDFTLEDAKEIERIMLEAYAFDGVANGTDLEVMTRWGEGVSISDWFKTKGER